MAIVNAIDVDLFSMCVLGFIYANTHKRAEHAFTQHRLFTVLIVNLALLLLFDALARLADGMPGHPWFILNWASNILLFLLVPFAPAIWAFYANYQVHHDEKKFRPLYAPLLAYALVNAFFTLASPWTGWFFTVDGGNFYRRGPLVLLHALMSLFLLLIIVGFIVRNRKRIDQRYLATLLLFAIPPAVGGLLQCLFYGLSLIWSGMTLSVLLLYFNIQDRRLDTDYLTGTFNRRLLDGYIRSKIKSSTAARSFSAILIDLDNFKQINDLHGHITGDDALLDAVGVIRKCLRNNDMFARYGGDEFLVVLNISDAEVLKEAVERIKECCSAFNEATARPYCLSFSTGHAVYDPASGLDAAGFLKHIDGLMYQNKRQLAK